MTALYQAELLSVNLAVREGFEPSAQLLSHATAFQAVFISHSNISPIYWLGWRDLNPRMTESKSVALPTWLHPNESGGVRRVRTADLLHAMQALSLLSYDPDLVGE